MPFKIFDNNPDDFDSRETARATLVEGGRSVKKIDSRGSAINNWGFLNAMEDRPPSERAGDMTDRELAIDAERTAAAADEFGVDLEDPIEIDGFDPDWYDADERDMLP